MFPHTYTYTAPQLKELYKGFIKDYPIVSIEDGFDQDDWDGWASFTAETDIQVMGVGVQVQQCIPCMVEWEKFM